jgi:hypothetical protein
MLIPFSDKLMLYHISFLFQAAQNYYLAELGLSMRSDLVVAYEGNMLKNITVTKKWLMVQNNWSEPPFR